jgi:hypothetical protein
MPCVPIAAKRRQPSLRYSDWGAIPIGDLARLGVTSVPGYPRPLRPLPASAGERQAPIAGSPSQSFVLLSELLLIVNMAIILLAKSAFQADEATPVFPPLLAP